MSQGSDIGSITSDISNIDLFISDTDIRTVLHPKSSLTEIAKKLVGIHTIMTKKEFETQAHNLYKCCLKGVRDMHELHRRRIVGMAIIDDMILRMDPNYVTMQDVIHVIWSIMSCIHHFQLRLKTGKWGIVHYVRRRRVEKCVQSYAKLIQLFPPTMHRIILNAIITFYKEAKLWEIEFACTHLILLLLKIYEDVEEAVNDILTTAEAASVNNEEDTKYLMQVLYELLRKVRWRKMSAKLMLRMLTMMSEGIGPSENSKCVLVPLKRATELCIRNVIRNLQNDDLLVMLAATLSVIDPIRMDEVALLDFGNIAAYAANRYTVKTFYRKFKPELLQSIFNLAHTKDPVAIFVSARIWLNLIDRNNNSIKLRTPRIYFQDCKYDITVKKCSRSDRLFFKKLRKDLYNVILESFQHAIKLCEVETVFQALALSSVEIPCGYSAATVTAVAMCLQAYAFKLEDLVRSNHLHATVLSLLSLVCYVHKAKIFHEYVNTIMERRAEWAPHLNPPLKPRYEYAQHHILWNKPELFFEEWEVRYGLWKCFRLKKKSKRHKRYDYLFK